MLAEFFQLGPLPTDMMKGTYNLGLVVLSYLVAVSASYIALDFTERLRDPSNTPASSIIWLLGGAIPMGAGIWSMHFIGMLSFSMPGMEAGHYDLIWTSISLVVAIIASFFALSLLKSKLISTTNLVLGGVILGLAIASMHYTGMEAMKTTMNIRYLPNLFFLSLIIAILASEAALWLALKSTQVPSKVRIRLKIISAIIMGIAICGMHYTGMFAAVFTPKEHMIMGPALDHTMLSMSIAAVTFIILGTAFLASTYKEAMNQQQLETARKLGMAEVSASILHNVGNVLNSVNVSANLIAENIANSNMEELIKLSTLVNEHKNDLAEFILKDPRGNKIPYFLELLAKYWKDQKIQLTEETDALRKNLQHIKDIISTQQKFSKKNGLEHFIDINDMLDEVLLIVGLHSDHIFIDKKYQKIKPILTDRIKLLQILVNLLTNAKYAVDHVSVSNQKNITVQSVQMDKVIRIIVKDSGVGIDPKVIDKIFTYGFTTKETGHGFGLHTCALSAHEMGGNISAASEGLNQGATFILELPYRTSR